MIRLLSKLHQLLFNPITPLLLLGLTLSLSPILIPYNYTQFIKWWLVLAAIGLTTWPLAAKLSPHSDYGFLLSKALGLGIIVLLSYLTNSIGFLPYTSITLWGIGIFVAAFCWLLKPNRTRLVEALKSDATFTWVLYAELLFLGLLLFWAFMRAQKPGLDSLEKMMNIGFMSSLWRTNWLPAADMWLSSHSINYYYLGHFSITSIAKLANIIPPVSYNLGIATIFAFTFSLAFHIGKSILLTFASPKQKQPNIAAVGGGLLAATLVTIGGNGHAILYSPNGLLHPLLLFLERIGVANTNSLYSRPFFFSDSTRFIGHNPDLPDKTIHEFPYYSFLVADLHAHLIDVIFVLLLLSLTIPLIKKGLFTTDTSLDDLEPHRISFFRQPILWLVGGVMALMMMTNFWDFAIYTVALALVLLVAVRQAKHLKFFSPLSIAALVLQAGLLLLPFILIQSPWLALGCYIIAVIINTLLEKHLNTVITCATSALTFIFTLAHLFALPFNVAFEPISKTIRSVPRHSSLYQWLVLWAVMLIAGLVCIVPPWLSKLRQSKVNDESNEICTPYLWLTALFVTALVMLLIPELVYVKDIYGLNYARANTMFKFTYQAFILLMLVWGIGVGKLFSDYYHNRKRSYLICAMIAFSLIVVPLTYPIVSTKHWLGDISIKNAKNLDGTSTMRPRTSPVLGEEKPNSLADSFALIDWLNQNVTGQPTILEVTGPSYTENCLVSSFTGLPTVLGWNAHEWLWRTSTNIQNANAQIIMPRERDIATMYQTSSAVELLQFLKLYNVTYIVVSDFERKAYPTLNESTIAQATTLVFRQGSASLYRVK